MRDMKDFIIYTLIGLGVWVGAKYKKAYELAKKLSFSFFGFSYDEQGKDYITLSFYIYVKNPSNEDILLNSSNLKCYLNSSYAGVAFIPYQQIIKAVSTTRILIAVKIQYKTVFSNFWNLFLKAATSVHLTISGSLRFNGVFVPIPALDIAEFNLKDAIQSINKD